MNKSFFRIFVCFLLLFSPLALAETMPELTLESAQRIAAKATAYAKKKNWNLSIAIVNSEGNLLYFQRDEHAYSGSIDSAVQKARSANAFQRPTSAFVEAIKQGKIGIVTGKDIIAIEGGIPIVLGGKHVGSIGISGAKAVEDEECAKVALE